MTLISVDLAYERYSDMGLVVIHSSPPSIVVVPISLTSVGLEGTPEIEELGSFLASLVDELNASFVFLDGPQGWKDPDNGLEESRRCEYDLGTPYRTGLPGFTKPASFLEFAHFSVSLFQKLNELSLPRLATTGGWPNQMTVESSPESAWRSIGVGPLPQQGEVSPTQVAAGLDSLKNCFPLDVRGELSHGELQATVSGLAGVALERRNMAGLAFAGVEPIELDGDWREGYVLNPTREAGA